MFRILSNNQVIATVFKLRRTGASATAKVNRINRIKAHLVTSPIIDTHIIAISARSYADK